MNKQGCQYLFSNGKKCSGSKEKRSLFCFFHNSKNNKTTPAAKKKILFSIKQGENLEGARLDKANLERCHLEKAHLYGASLKGANLFNANLQNANLKKSNLINAQLLEVKLQGAKLLGVNLGEKLVNEIEAIKLEQKKQLGKAKEKYQEAEEIYRNFRLNFQSNGLFDDASHCLYKEMVMRRKKMPKYSIKRFLSKLIDLLCGYGEKPYRVLASAFTLVFTISVLQFFAGLKLKDEILKIDLEQSFQTNLYEYFACLYFSVVSFTTRGFGDITPYGFSRLFAATEAFIGAFMIALFVLVFVKKMIR